MTRLWLLFWACAGAAVLSGCAGYQLGPVNGATAGEKAIQVNPFVNHTLEPRLGDAVTAALRKEVQRDGSYRLSTSGGADFIVSGTITRYDRHELSFVPNDVLTVSDFRVNLTAQLVVHEVSTGKDRTNTVTGYTLIRVGSDLTSAERQAIPLLAEDLARNAASALVDGAW